MSGPTYNQPASPSYGEGMADALKAQVELLTGTGDFASTGSLESLLPLEESIRKKTAQTDTDVLRQTLLGGDVTYNEDGKILEGYTDAAGKTIEVKPRPVFAQYGTSGPGVNTGSAYLIKPNSNYDGRSKPTPDQILYEYNIDGKSLTPDVKKEFFNKLLEEGYIDKSQNEALVTQAENPDFESRGLGDHIAPQEELVIPEDAQPIFKKDNAGNDIVRTDLANTTQRQGDGMVDLLGDKRNVLDTRKLSKSEQAIQLIEQNPELQALYDFAQNDQGNPLGGLTKEQAGRTLLSQYENTDAMAEALGISSIDLPDYDQVDSGRQAGFDESGNFLGLSAYGEDIQAGNLSRQRERDLQDVARLSGTYQDIMEDYKPGTQEALESAREVLEGQKDSLTGAGAIGGPQGITAPLSLTSKGFDAAQNTTPVDLAGDTSFTGASVADPMSLTADTSYTADTGVAGSGYTATAGLDGGRIKADSLRARLMKDAEAGLDQGLTDREERQIAEAARARSTMMGRTFDQSGAIAEAEARVAEDNARKMQNRAFAQQALGQEAGFQESDLGRALQAGIQNQAAKNRAGEFTAGQDMQAQLANQQATNRASEFGVQAGLNQEQLQANMAQQKAMADAGFTQQARAAGLEAGLTQEQAEAQLNQQRLMANQQFSQEANKYGAQEDMQVQLNNLANQISNYQFETGAQMDADRLNEQLKQSGILGYIQAAGGLAALEDSSTLDPFQAVLGRGGGGSLQAGQSVFGQAGYGLNSGPAYLNPESGLGYIQNQATNAANMYNANVAADATKTAGIYGGIGSALGGLGGGLLGNSNLFK
jgi:hypothetical protein